MNKITRLEVILHEDETYEAYIKGLNKTIYLESGDILVFNATFVVEGREKNMVACDIYPVDKFWSTFRKYEHWLFKIVTIYERTPYFAKFFIPEELRKLIIEFIKEKENETN